MILIDGCITQIIYLDKKCDTPMIQPCLMNQYQERIKLKCSLKDQARTNKIGNGLIVLFRLSTNYLQIWRCT